MVGFGGVLGGELGRRVDLGRLWSPKRPPHGAMLRPSSSHVAAKLTNLGFESVIFAYLKSSANLSSNWNQFFNGFEAPAGCPGRHFVL